MGVRDVAAAAVDAKKAKDKADGAKWQKRNGDIGVLLVQQGLGLSGKFVRAYKNDRTATDLWGDGTVVRVEDDNGPLFIQVSIANEHRTDRWSGRTEVTGRRVQFRLVTKDGMLSFPHPYAEWSVTLKDGTVRWSPLDKSFDSFTDLVGLARALREHDAFMAATTPEELGYNPSYYPDRVRFTNRKDGK